MDRRREPRIEVRQRVLVHVLNDQATSTTGVIENVSGRGLRLLVDRKIPVDSAIRLEWDKNVALGEVCYCHPSGERYVAGLALDQFFRRTSDLVALAKAMRLEPGEPGRPTGVFPRRVNED